jgi:VanZ family protein
MKKILNKNPHFKKLFFITVIAVFILALVPSEQISLHPYYDDKIKHLIAFFTLSFLLNRSSSSIEKRLRNMGALLLFGIFIEFVQYFVPSRQSSINDVIADFMGILLFQLTYSLLKLIQEQRNKRKMPNKSL